MSEKVIGVSRSIVERYFNFDGLIYSCGSFVEMWNRRELVDRDEAEHDPSFKQIIPYVLLMRDNDVVYYQRTKQSGEQRLFGKFSVGFGGHINSMEESVATCARREVKEELNLNMEPQCVALLNDDSNAVGQVHLGVVMIAQVSSTLFMKPSPEIFEPMLGGRPVLMNKFSAFEDWSQLCIKHLDKLIYANV